MKLRDWLTKWITEIHRDELRPKTRADYARVCAQISESIGDRRLEALTPDDVRGMIEHLGKGRRRTQKAHAVLQAALRDAESDGLVKRNVAAVVRKPKVDTQKRDPFTAETTRALLDHAHHTLDPMAYARWAAAFLTGLRQGEVLGLEWDRVDLDGAVVDVSWQLQSLQKDHGCGRKKTPDGKFPCGKVKAAYCPDAALEVPPDYAVRPLYRSLVLTRPKTQAGQRYVPLIPAMVDALRGAMAAPGFNPHGLVFHHADGRPWSPRDDYNNWQALLIDAGITEPGKPIPLHSARHTTATVMRSGGADEQTRQEILGHSSADAQRVYAHADMRRQRAAMEALKDLAPPSDGV